jgi:hypothetical protein
MRRLQVNAKCRFHFDSEGWLHTWDGHAGNAFAPDEVEALRKFLAEGAALPESPLNPIPNPHPKGNES